MKSVQKRAEKAKFAKAVNIRSGQTLCASVDALKKFEVAEGFVWDDIKKHYWLISEWKFTFYKKIPDWFYTEVAYQKLTNEKRIFMQQSEALWFKRIHTRRQK